MRPYGDREQVERKWRSSNHLWPKGRTAARKIRRAQRHAARQDARRLLREIAQRST